MTTCKKRTLAIVIPVYNTDIDLLTRCIRSVPNNNSIKLYIYDDCSTKYNVASEVDKIMSTSELSNVEYSMITLPENIGLGAVRNKAIREIDDCYNVLFLDSDDEVIGNTVNKCVSDINHDYIDGPVLILGIDLISGDKVKYEHPHDMMMEMNMIPYFVTPIIYNLHFLRVREIFFDDTKKVFEDIPFTIKLWTTLIDSTDDYDGVCSYSIYKYYLQGQSLTRTENKEKYLELSNTLLYWIDWIENFYKNYNYTSNDEEVKSLLKKLLINRIRYEATKALEYRSKYDGIDYSKFLNLMKYYKLRDTFN